MVVHREEGGFVVRIELSAAFDADYEGDDDGYAWLTAWRERVRPRVARAVLTELRAEPGFVAIPVSRGRNPEDELEIAVTFERGSVGAPGPGGEERQRAGAKKTTPE